MRLLAAKSRESALSRPGVLFGALALTAGLLIAPASAASAENSMTDLGAASSITDLVAGGDKVAVSIDDHIVIADSTGQVKGTITGLSGAYGLAMTPDGTHLYAALMGSKEVAEIDTATLEITRRVDLAAYGCPSSLALTGERLWVGYGGCGGATGALGLDLSVTVPEPVPFEVPLKAGPYLAAAGNTLVVGEGGGSPADLFVYDVSGTTPVFRGEIDGHTYFHGGLNDVAVTPDGSHVISAFTLPDAFEKWDATTLARVHAYEKGPEAEGYPATVAVSPDGAYIAGGRNLFSGEMTLYDTASGSTIYAARPPEGEIVGGSAAFSGHDILSLVKTNADHLYLWRINDPTVRNSTLTVTAAPDATAQQPLTLTGRLTFDDGTAPGAQPLSVTRTLPDGSSAELPGATTAADGTFTITDTPPTGGEVTYTVRWNGDESHRGSEASVTTAVRYASMLTLNGPTRAVAGTKLVFRGSLRVAGITAPRNVRLTVERIRSGDDDVIQRSVRTGIGGSYAFTDILDAGVYTYTVRWAGDDRTGPAQAGHVVTVHERTK
ncbi:WD40 repeat domain-containing protein [Nonomuraea sp. FMUSA5-5]|uniref:WD40 repeat domain-containing protein n=1 Tax=Nonomuraea composti TaxID=2720023 RepID=A0ABX1AXS1_9ACTN|nr:WD40 repeat domain-containing protein [Nonomuraea sp. FMUSA5-5]NJP90405.1 WD40 repeat domain-containing protein [Nonomuraea sp. FMUSA5-5]